LLQKPDTHNPSLGFIKPGFAGNALDAKGRYINLDGPSERSFKELLRWQTGPKPLKKLKKKQQSSVAVTHNAQLTKDANNGITWLGHASFLFSLNGKQLITDPVLYNVSIVKRYTPLPCAVSDLTGIDYILLSHNHRDHADKKSMQQLCALNPNAIILTALGIGPLLRQWNITNTIIEAGWYQNYQLAEAFNITFLPAKHWNRRGLTDTNTMLWGSFMLQHQQHTVYFGADSGLGIHFEDIAQLFPNIDYALLGIGAYMPEWFMHTSHTSPAGALQAFAQLRAKQLIPMHHGTFDLSDEPIFYPKEQISIVAAQQNINGLLHLNIGSKHYL
jgi:L-ascorbate metabolism protein UlaG (beta-lactamase superfamily)